MSDDPRNSSSAANDSVYVLGRTTEEHERLRRQAEILEPVTRRILGTVGVAKGMHCLDVGCGPGEVMRIFAEMSGPSGRVVGVDLDAKLGAESLAILHSKGHRQCEFYSGDMYSQPQLREESFDIVFSRLVLEHLDDPIMGIRQMYRWVKPGGALVLQDFYFPSLDAYPESVALGELLVAFPAVFLKMNRELRMGLKMPTYMIRAGAGAPDGTDVSGFLKPMSESAGMMSAVYKSVLPLALEYDVTDEARSREFFEQIANPDEDRYMLWPLLVSVWKRKRT